MSDTTVLLIDDDPDVLTAIGSRCQTLGWNVQTARNLLTAMKLVESNSPDVICVDVRLPTGDGLRFCEELAADPATSNIRLVALTGQRDAETISRCRRLGAHYVPKRPDVWSELEPLLRELRSGSFPADSPSAIDDQKTAAAGSRVPAGDGRMPSPPIPSANRSIHMPLAGRTIVIADDDDDLVNVLSQRCAQLGCRAIGASNGLEAINVIHRVLPDLVCIDVNMPAGNGLCVTEMMAEDDRLRETPVIVLTGVSDPQTIRRCHEMMVYYVEKGGNVWERVEPLLMELLGDAGNGDGRPPGKVPEPDEAVRQAVRPSTTAVSHPVQSVSYQWPSASDTPSPNDPLLDAVFAMLSDPSETAGRETDDDLAEMDLPADDEPPWVLCIDDDPDFSDALMCRLESYGVAVIRAFCGMEGYRMAFTQPARAILLDYHMPDGQGDYILGRLQDNPVTRSIPVIVITGVCDKSLERKMYGLGAKSFLNKPVRFEAVRDELAKYIDILSRPAEATAASHT